MNYLLFWACSLVVFIMTIAYNEAITNLSNSRSELLQQTSELLADVKALRKELEKETTK